MIGPAIGPPIGRSSRLVISMLPFLGAACAAPQSGDATTSPSPPPLFAAGATLPATGAADAEDVLPWRDGTWDYALVVDGAAAEARPFTARPEDEFGASFAVDKGPGRTDYFSVDSDGTVRLPATIDHAQHALTQFRPSLPVAWSRLEAGAERRTEVAMRVVDSRNRSRERERGRATITTRYAEDQLVRTPTGEHRAQRIEVLFEADLRLADVTRRSTYWIVPGLGVAAVEHAEQVRVLGLPGAVTEELLVLMSPPASRPPVRRTR